MVDKGIRRLLLEKLNISKQALSSRAQTIKNKYGPMSTDDAVYIIAHQNGIDLSRYISVEILDRVRALVPRELPAISNHKTVKVRSRKKKAEADPLKYPLVTSEIIRKSTLIGNESFPQIFVLENSIRNLIKEKLKKKHGKDWWINSNIKSIRDNIKTRIDKEKKYPHREKRGDHPIYYTNFSDLKQIILNERNVFLDVIIDLRWFEVEMDEVYMARNALAHSTIISEDDTARIRLFYRDWARLLENSGY